MAKKSSLLILLSVTTLLFSITTFAQTTFTNVARDAGLLKVRRYLSLGVAWGDYDNDGDLDLYVAHGDWAGWKMEADVFYRNNGDGSFTDVTAEAGFGNNTGQSWYAGFFDYNNDGHLDLYVYNSTNEDNRVVLYTNNGDGTFADETEESGIRDFNGTSYSGGFGDYDNDGNLDLHIARWGWPNILYRNNGDETFTDMSVESNLGNLLGGFNFASGDYDNDGDLDIYLANGAGLEVQPCALYQNKGDGTFEDVAKKAGVDDDRNGRCAALMDYDNDGDLDLFAAGCHSTARFYRNEGDGTFEEMTTKAGLQISGHCERLTVGDYDNDGYIDAFVMFWNSSKMLYHNNGDGTFTNVAKEAGVLLQQGNGGGCAFADYDNDGDLDLYVAHHSGVDALYRNNGNNNHWLHIKATGTKSNRNGVGARVTVRAGQLSMIREINGGCARAQHSLTANFGLGQNVQADSIEIRWPSRQVTALANVPADQMIEVTEGAEGYKTLHRGEGFKAVEPSGKGLSMWGVVKGNKLYQNYPNPFNPETWFPYQLARPADVKISIYTESGKLVRTLNLGRKDEGMYLEKSRAAYWDGENDAGEPAVSGVYFYKLEAGDFKQTRKMTVLK
jgi:hypothetical protein